MKQLRWQILVAFVTLVIVAALLLTQQLSRAWRPILSQPGAGRRVHRGARRFAGAVEPSARLVSADRDVDRLLFSGPVKFDERGDPARRLGASVGVATDGTIYNLTIRRERGLARRDACHKR
ncbi:MAG: hypothetical protein U0V48_05030 [Anaerolineales bacterium]